MLKKMISDDVHIVDSKPRLKFVASPALGSFSYFVLSQLFTAVSPLLCC
jgi:hypothetical protein